MAGKEENKKLEAYENENVTCFDDQTSSIFYIIASVSTRKITQSHGTN